MNNSKPNKLENLEKMDKSRKSPRNKKGIILKTWISSLKSSHADNTKGLFWILYQTFKKHIISNLEKSIQRRAKENSLSFSVKVSSTTSTLKPDKDN